MRRIHILAGLCLAVAGAVWLVARLGGIDKALATLAQWWPAAVIALGVLNLLALVRRPTWLLAPLLLIVGGGLALLATQQRELPADVRPYVWPVVLTALGVVVALWERDRLEGDYQFVRQTVVLRSRRFHSTTANFQHGVVRTVLGNLELDLQRCELRQDAELCVTAVLGHVDLLPPPECQVRIKGRQFGAWVTVPDVPPLPDSAGEPSALPVLEVSVMGFVGGFDVRTAWSSREVTGELLDDPGAGADPTSESDFSALMAGRRP